MNKATERRDPTVATPAKYLGRPGFNSRQATDYPGGFHGFSQSLEARAGIVP
jgi:hypothetical protein